MRQRSKVRTADLRETQRCFFRALETDRARGGASRLITGGGQLRPRQRLEIYASMYFARILEALREDFPKLLETIGEDGFAALARRYLRAHPSRHPSLRHVGDRLPAFVKQDRIATGVPWLSELARLERAIVDAFDGPEAKPLLPAALTRIPGSHWGRLRFTLHPTLRLLQFSHAVDEVWERLDAGKAGGRPAARLTRLRIWRREHVVLRAPMDAREATCLRALARGRDFSWVCVRCETADRAARDLATWLDEGLITGIELSPGRLQRPG